VSAGATAAPTSEAAARPPTGHRERLIAAMGISVEEKGFRNTAVSDVVRIARTSRRSFYEHFADRDACFLALFEATTEEMTRAIRRAVRSRDAWEEQVDAALEAYFASVAARPKLFRSFTREPSRIFRFRSRARLGNYSALAEKLDHPRYIFRAATYAPRHRVVDDCCPLVTHRALIKSVQARCHLEFDATILGA